MTGFDRDSSKLPSGAVRMLPVVLLRTMRPMMLLGAPAVVAMAMLASPGLYALRLHSTAKATVRSLPHKSIPSLARGPTTDTCTRRRGLSPRRCPLLSRRGYAIVARPRKHPRVARRPCAALTFRETPIRQNPPPPVTRRVTIAAICETRFSR